MRVALYEPEIAGRVGAALRLGACLGAAVGLIAPLGLAPAPQTGTYAITRSFLFASGQARQGMTA